MDDILTAAYQTEEKRIGFAGMLRLLFLRPRTFFKETIAADKFPFLGFAAWLMGLAHSLQWMDKILLTQSGLVANRFYAFLLLLFMSFAFMGILYSIGGLLLHFCAYLADSRKDMKHSVALAVYAWMPFVVAVFLTKLIAVALLGGKYLVPPSGWWFQIPSWALLGLSLLYGWFLAIYGAVVGLGCKKFRSILMLFVVPVLSFVLIFMIIRFMGFV